MISKTNRYKVQKITVSKAALTFLFGVVLTQGATIGDLKVYGEPCQEGSQAISVGFHQNFAEKLEVCLPIKDASIYKSCACTTDLKGLLEEEYCFDDSRFCEATLQPFGSTCAFDL